MITNEDKLHETCDFYGKIDISVNAMEECSELIQCIAKGLRGLKDPSHMEEEIGDVTVALSNLIYIYELDKNKIQQWIDFKQNRQLARLKLEREGKNDTDSLR